MKTLIENKSLIAKPTWERVNKTVLRLPVFGGWIVTVTNSYDDQESAVFIPDPMHCWEIVPYVENNSQWN